MIPAANAFDFLEPGSDGVYPLSFRLVRFLLPDGSRETPLTNLLVPGRVTARGSRAAPRRNDSSCVRRWPYLVLGRALALLSSHALFRQNAIKMAVVITVPAVDGLNEMTLSNLVHILAPLSCGILLMSYNIILVSAIL